MKLAAVKSEESDLAAAFYVQLDMEKGYLQHENMKGRAYQ